MAAANGGGSGHVRSKSEPAEVLTGHEPIRPHGFGVLRQSISMDSVDFYFGGMGVAEEAMEEVSKFVRRTMKGRRDHLDAVFDLWMRGHLRSRSDPQLVPAELRHRPIRPHGFFSLLRRSVSMDSVEFYFRGIDNAGRVMNAVHRFVTLTVEARGEVIDDADDDVDDAAADDAADDDAYDDAHDGVPDDDDDVDDGVPDDDDDDDDVDDAAAHGFPDAAPAA